MENYFHMNLTEKEINTFSNLSLAHIGDGVFELLCRSYLCSQGAQNVGNLHRDTVKLVKAPAQAAFADKLLPHLTESELAYYRRGKNTHVHAVPKGASPPTTRRPPAWKQCSALCIWPAGRSGSTNCSIS